jgi:hypothetical protein
MTSDGIASTYATEPRKSVDRACRQLAIAGLGRNGLQIYRSARNWILVTPSLGNANPIPPTRPEGFRIE